VAENGLVAVVEGLLVLVVVALVVYGFISWLLKVTGGPAPRENAVSAGRWRSAHYEKQGCTRVVLQKVSPDGNKVLDEHTVATIAPGDPDYEDKFLAAMLAARQRQALFESEEG
jgi:hypothetical protein